MSTISENLKQSYDAFIQELHPYDFFVGLADYVNYIVETPTMREIIDTVMKKKEVECDKLAELENKAISELRGAKEKLLKIIKDCDVDPNLLQGHWSSLPGVNDGLLNELERFEKGDGISIIGFHSDSLQSYLFDIAVGISAQDKKDALKKFIVSNKEYRKYSGADSNVYGNFVFSKTLRERREQEKLIEKAKRLELWGAFDHLLKFQKAFSEECKNTHFVKVLEKYSDRSRNYLEGRDAVDITFATQDLRTIVNSRYGRVLDDNMHFLVMPNFKTYVKRVNTHLSKELSVLQTEKAKKPSISALHLNATGDLWQEPKDGHCYPIIENSNRHKIVRYLATHNGYQQTSAISSDLGGKSEQSIRNDIEKINRNIKKFLKIGSNIIESKRGSGYRISPKYNITTQKSV